MTIISSFKDFAVWQVSIDLADVCFDIVEAISRPYRFIFADQLIPAGISIRPMSPKEADAQPRRTSTICPIHLDRTGLVPDPLLTLFLPRRVVERGTRVCF